MSGHKFRILVTAGGAVFGYNTSQLIANSPLDMDAIDVFAGTSAGSINAASYAIGKDPAEVRDKYESMMSDVFQRWWISKLWPYGAEYSDERLNASLSGFIKGTCGEAERSFVVPTIDLEKVKPKVWDNITNGDAEEPLWEVVRRSCAAPTYFNPWKGHIDGGLMENIPCVTAITAVADKIGVPLEEISMLVVGTGKYKNEGFDMSSSSSWTFVKWAEVFSSLLTRVNEEASIFWADKLPLGGFRVFNPTMLDKDWDIDDASLIPEMKSRCAEVQDDFNKMVEEFLLT